MKIENLLVALCVSVFAAYSCSPIEKPDVPDSETPVPDTESPEDPEEPETPSDPGNTDDNSFPYAESDVILYDNFDKVDVSGGSQYVNQSWATYSNATGCGASAIDYGKSAYSSFQNNFTSIGYPGASGHNAVSLNKNTSLLSVQKVRIPLDKRNYKLAFGLNSYVNGSNEVKEGETVHIFVAGGTSGEFEIPWKAKQYQKWFYVTSDFAVAGDVQDINVTVKSAFGNAKIDDLTLVVTSDTPSVTLDFTEKEHEQYWLPEIPKVIIDSPDYKYISHSAKTYRTKQLVRNYSACYNTRYHNPMWVAYPCHEIYWEGGYKRPVKDPWRPDPEMSESEQSIIYPSNWNSWPWDSETADNYQYWCSLPTMSKYFTRGHLMRSAERGCGDKYTLLDLNAQTFYPTNIAPEAYMYAANAKGETHWTQVESLLPSEWRCSDTLFVVAGCHYENENLIVYDATYGSNKTDGKSKQCLVPTARYKIIMRTKAGNTKKKINECTADEVMAIGFWFPQNPNFDGTYEIRPLSEFIYSVSEIEQMTGGTFNFFPSAPEGVKDSYNIADWPGLSDLCKNQ